MLVGTFYLECCMLDPASVPPPKPAVSTAAAGSVRPAAKEEGGFHDVMREALESPKEEQRAPQSKVEAKAVDRGSADRPEPQASVVEEKTLPEDGAGLSVAASKLEAVPSRDLAPAAPAEALLTDPAVADVADNSAAVAPPSLTAPDMAASLVLPQPAAALPAVPLMAQGAAGVLGGADVPQSVGNPSMSGAHAGADGALAQNTSEASAAALPNAAVPVDARAAMAAKQTEAGGIPQPAEFMMAQPGNPLDAEAQALRSAEQLRSQMVSVQQGGALSGSSEMAPGPEQLIANALAAGSAQAQAVASQGAQTQQTILGARKSAPADEAAEAAQWVKPAAPMALLATALGKLEAAADMKLVVTGESKEAALHLASVEASAPASAKPSGDIRAEGLSMQPFGPLTSDGMLQRAEAPVSSAPAREFSAPLPARQLAPVVVSLMLGRGDEALTIALDPVELGRVEVSIGQGKDAGQVRIVAERPETLALLQRDQRELDRALNQAGLGDMARSLSFSLASDQGRQQQQHAAHQGGSRFSGALGGIEADRPSAPLPQPARASLSLLDIAV